LDPAGHNWSLHQSNSTLTPEEMQRLFDAM